MFSQGGRCLPYSFGRVPVYQLPARPVAFSFPIMAVEAGHIGAMSGAGGEWFIGLDCRQKLLHKRSAGGAVLLM